MNDEHWATVIKVAAVAVVAPRWIGALLEAEGVPLPAEWRGWWVVFSAVCAAGMALVEAGAFAYCLRSWRGMTGRSANIMALMISASAVTFVVVLSPYIAANVSKVSMSKLLVDSLSAGLVGGRRAIHDPDHCVSRIRAEAPSDATDRHPCVSRRGRHEQDAYRETRTGATREEFVTA